METQRYIDRARHLEKPRKSVFDSSQLSGSINVQDGGIMLFPNKKTTWIGPTSSPGSRLNSGQGRGWDTPESDHMLLCLIIAGYMS